MLDELGNAVSRAISMGDDEEISQRSLQFAWLGGTAIGMAIQGARHNKMVKVAAETGGEVRPFKALLF